MGPRTRSATNSPVKNKTQAPPSADEQQPLNFFVLPRDTAPDARFLLLDHPRENAKRRFFFCPKNGLYNFTNVTTPSIDPTSILFAPSDGFGLGDDDVELGVGEYEGRLRPNSIAEGYVNKAAEFFVATPFDLSFLLLPILAGPKGLSSKSLFQPLDDILEEHIEKNRHLRYISQRGRAYIEAAVERFCDSIEAGDEKMYRISEKKIVKDILDRAQRAVAAGLPPSLEEKFVARGLERPVLSMKRESSTVVISEQGRTPDIETVTDGFESQSTAVSSTASTVFSTVSSTSATTTIIDDQAPADIIHLQRLRIAFTFIASSCLPIEISEQLMKILDLKDSPVDFDLLNEHLKMLTALRAEALASRSVTDFSRKRGGIDDDAEEAESRAEKKRKIDEEEKRKKAGESRGVRDLKKVNTQGMQKMTAFFNKKPAVAKVKT